MIFLILNIIFFLSLWISKYIFKKWINPLSIYTVIWYAMLSFYHLKLINYDDLSSETWFVIVAAHISLFLGSITYFTAFDALKSNHQKNNSSNNLPLIFFNDGKILFWLALIFGLIGLFSAIQTWLVLLKMFSNIFEALLHLGKVYQMRVEGELDGVIPYLTIFIIASIFFSAVYSAYHGKIKLITVLPLVSLVAKEIALAQRATILLGFLEFAFTFVFMTYAFKKVNNSKKVGKKVLSFQIIILISFLFFSVIAVKNLRGAGESFLGETRAMKKLQDSPFISPSLYLYTSGHVGVLNKYLEKANEPSNFGQNTFLFVYNALSKVDLVSRPDGYQKAYYIPVWINTGTYIRELISDFSFPMTLVIVFWGGFLVAFYWNRFFIDFNILYLVFLVFITILFALSFLTVISRLANWALSLVFIPLVLSIVEHLLKHKKLNKEF